MKTAITIPKEVFEEIEKIRKETGMSRSQILVDGFVYSKTAKEAKDWEKKYEAAYKKNPETPEEIRSINKMTEAELAAWPKDDW